MMSFLDAAKIGSSTWAQAARLPYPNGDSTAVKTVLVTSQAARPTYKPNLPSVLSSWSLAACDVSRGDACRFLVVYFGGRSSSWA